MHELFQQVCFILYKSYQIQIPNQTIIIRDYSAIRISSAESQKGIKAVQCCSIENQKDAIAIDFVQR